MQIKKVEIKNFRNIKDVTYDFGRRTGINGRNHTGKTNTIQAVYWVLCDSLLDNSNDFDSIVPTSDNRALTSVKLTFDNGSTFEKTYREKWTRTRGSDTEKLTGHETTYTYNGATIGKKTEADRIITELIFGDGADKASNLPISLSKAMVNPLYLFLQEDWKKAREFILKLVGEVDDNDVFIMFPNLNPIRDDLEKFNGRTDQLLSKYNSDVLTLGKQSKNEEAIINETEKAIEENKVTDEEYAKAKAFMESYRTALEGIKKGDSVLVTADIDREINNISQIISELNTSITSEERTYFNDYTLMKDHAESQYIKALNRKNQLSQEIESLKNGNENLQKELEDNNRKLSDAYDAKKLLGEEYVKVKKSEFYFAESVCPHCGAVLNEEEEEKAKEAFESNKNAKLMTIAEKGKAMATEISRLEAIAMDIQGKLSDDPTLRISQLSQELARASENVNLKAQLMQSIEPKKSDKRTDLEHYQARLKELNEKKNLAIEGSKKSTQEQVDGYINDHWSEVEQANAVIKKKTIADYSEKKLLEQKTTHDHTIKLLSVAEENREILKQFILKKLDMINASTQKAFPDIEFVLIENNIKEGSFNQVCYPLIKGKKTPFANGSNSERILTGIALIEDIRKAMELPDIPIIFDEGETMDSVSFKEIATDSQVITTIVNDKYSEPYVVSHD